MNVCVPQLGALPGPFPEHSTGPVPQGKSPCTFPSSPPQPRPEGVSRPQRPRGRALTWDLPADTCPTLRRGGMNNLNRFSFSMAPIKGRAGGPRRRHLSAAAEGGRQGRELRRPLSAARGGRGRRLAELPGRRALFRGNRDCPTGPAGLECRRGRRPGGHSRTFVVAGKVGEVWEEQGVRRGRGIPPVQGINGGVLFSCDPPGVVNRSPRNVSGWNVVCREIEC